MITPDDYRQHADECLKAIWSARVPEARSLLLSIAKCCIELAERTERQEHSQPPAGPEPIEEKKPPAPSIKRQPRRARNAETG